MSSWRDTASAQAQDDLDALLSATLPFAQQLLEKNGEFFPFGAMIEINDDLALTSADPAMVGEHPASADVIAALVERFRSLRDTTRAVAVVSDVQLGESHAVRVELEHRDGHSFAVILPYEQDPARRATQYGELALAGSRGGLVWEAG